MILRRPTLGWAMAISVLATSARAEPSPSLAVIPFANYAEDTLALSMVMPRVYAALVERNIHHVSETDIRPVLRRHRIRNVGQISIDGARVIGDATGARAILTGSVDVFDSEGSSEVAISARIVEVGSTIVARAASASIHRIDRVGLFGARSADSLEALVDHVLGEVVAEVAGWPDEGRGDQREPKVTLAVVPFDSAVDYVNAGDIVSTLLLPALLRGGYDVIEPGMVRELALQRSHVARGSVDYPFLTELHRELQTSIVITGTVESFERSRGQAGSPPLFEISARILDAVNARLLVGFHDSRNGYETETLFQRGRRHAVCQLAGDVMNDLVTIIDRESEAIRWTRAGAQAP